MLPDQEVLDLPETKSLGVVDQAVQLPFFYCLSDILYPSKDIIGVGIIQVLPDQAVVEAGHAELALDLIKDHSTPELFNKFIKP